MSHCIGLCSVEVFRGNSDWSRLIYGERVTRMSCYSMERTEPSRAKDGMDTRHDHLADAKGGR